MPIQNPLSAGADSTRTPVAVTGRPTYLARSPLAPADVANGSNEVAPATSDPDPAATAGAVVGVVDGVAVSVGVAVSAEVAVSVDVAVSVGATVSVEVSVGVGVADAVVTAVAAFELLWWLRLIRTTARMTASTASSATRAIRILRRRFGPWPVTEKAPVGFGGVDDELVMGYSEDDWPHRGAERGAGKGLLDRSGAEATDQRGR